MGINANNSRRGRWSALFGPVTVSEASVHGGRVVDDVKAGQVPVLLRTSTESVEIAANRCFRQIDTGFPSLVPVAVPFYPELCIAVAELVVIEQSSEDLVVTVRCLGIKIYRVCEVTTLCLD